MTDFIYNPVKENDLRVVVAFLMGEGSLQGVWYGEQPEGECGKFWWRKHLSTAISENVEAKPDWSGAADWIRNNYQNYPNISSLCEAMEEAAPGASSTYTSPINWENAMPGGKYTDKWESTRVADYNRGWNDYRKEAHKKLKAITAPTAQAAPAAVAGQCEDAIELLGKYKELCEEIKRGDSYHLGRIDSAISVLAQTAPQPAVQQGGGLWCGGHGIAKTRGGTLRSGPMNGRATLMLGYDTPLQPWEGSNNP